jgi:hypothetical protein
MEDALPRPPGLLERIRKWMFGEAGHPGVLNQPAPAAKAGDSPWLTSHGPGPSHAHDPQDDEPRET